MRGSTGVLMSHQREGSAHSTVGTGPSHSPGQRPQLLGPSAGAGLTAGAGGTARPRRLGSQCRAWRPAGPCRRERERGGAGAGAVLGATGAGAGAVSTGRELRVPAAAGSRREEGCLEELGDRGGCSDRRTVDRGADHAAIDRGSDHGTIDRSRAGNRAAGHFEVDCTEPDDQQDRASLVGLEDRVNSGLEPGRDQSLDARDGQFLILGIGQVDHLGHEVAAVDDLVEVLGGELDGDRVVSKVGVGRRGGRGDLDRRVEADAWRPGMFESFSR